jgi:hypothetical protein
MYYRTAFYWISAVELQLIRATFRNRNMKAAAETDTCLPSNRMIALLKTVVQMTAGTITILNTRTATEM